MVCLCWTIRCHSLLSQLKFWPGSTKKMINTGLRFFRLKSKIRLRQLWIIGHCHWIAPLIKFKVKTLNSNLEAVIEKLTSIGRNPTKLNICQTTNMTKRSAILSTWTSFVISCRIRSIRFCHIFKGKTNLWELLQNWSTSLQDKETLLNSNIQVRPMVSLRKSQSLDSTLIRTSLKTNFPTTSL